MRTRKTVLVIAVHAAAVSVLMSSQPVRTLTSCQVTLNVLRADPRRVDAPMLYTILMDWRCDNENDTWPPDDCYAVHQDSSHDRCASDRRQTMSR